MCWCLPSEPRVADRLDLRSLFERHVAELWIPTHLLPGMPLASRSTTCRRSKDR